MDFFEFVQSCNSEGILNKVVNKDIRVRKAISASALWCSAILLLLVENLNNM